MADKSYEQLLKIMERHGIEMSDMSGVSEQAQIAAYRKAAEDVRQRLYAVQGTMEAAGGDFSSNIRAFEQDVVTLLDSIENRIAELGGETRNNLSEGWSQATELGGVHQGAELSLLVDHSNVAGEGLRFAQVGSFTRLDTVAIEQGFGIAVADNAALTSEMQALVRNEVQVGIASGRNIRDIARNLDGVLEGGASRSEMITRWAVVKGYNLSRQAHMENSLQMVKTLKKQWLSQTDERACPHCLAQHGTVVEVTEAFNPENTYASTPQTPVGGVLLVPPSHPRCRCLIVAWDESFRPYTENTPEFQHEQARQLAVEKGYWRALEQPVKAPVEPINRLNRAFEVILGQSAASAEISYFQLSGSKMWMSLSDAVVNNRRGMLQLALNTSSGLRMARYQVDNYGDAHRLVVELLEELESGVGGIALPRRGFETAADLVKYRVDADGNEVLDDLWRFNILSRDESNMLDVVDDFVDRNEQLAFDFGIDKSVRSSTAGELEVQNLDYVKDRFGKWRTSFKRSVVEGVGADPDDARRVIRRGRRRLEGFDDARHSIFSIQREDDPDAVDEMLNWMIDKMNVGGLNAEDARLFQIWAADPIKARRDQALLRLRARMAVNQQRLVPPRNRAIMESLMYSPDQLADEAILGGAARKQFFLDPLGGKWMVKEGAERTGMADSAAMRLGSSMGLNVPDHLLDDQGRAIQRLLQGPDFEVLDPFTGRTSMQNLLSNRFAGAFSGRTSSLEENIRAAMSPNYRRLMRLAYGDLDFNNLSPDQVQQVREFMVWDWMVGNLDVDASQFVLDKRTGLFVHVDFERAFGEGFVGRNDFTKFAWSDDFYGTSVERFTEIANLYDGFLRQARRPLWSPRRGPDISMEDLQFILAQAEAVEPAIWGRQVGDALQALGGGGARLRQMERVSGNPVQAYVNRLTQGRRAFREFLESRGFETDFAGDLGQSLRGRASGNQIAVVKEILQGREKVAPAAWARPPEFAKTLVDDVLDKKIFKRQEVEVGWPKPPSRGAARDVAAEAEQVVSAREVAASTMSDVLFEDGLRGARKLVDAEILDSSTIRRAASDAVEFGMQQAIEESAARYVQSIIAWRFRNNIVDIARSRQVSDELLDEALEELDEVFGLIDLGPAGAADRLRTLAIPARSQRDETFEEVVEEIVEEPVVVDFPEEFVDEVVEEVDGVRVTASGTTPGEVPYWDEEFLFTKFSKVEVEPVVARGSLGKQFLVDSDGNIWMFKEFRDAQNELVAHQVGEVLGIPMSPGMVVDVSELVGGRPAYGFLQKLLDGVDPEDTWDSLVFRPGFEEISDEVKEQMFQSLIYDWFIQSADTHGRNFLYSLDRKKFYGVDKSDAFTWILGDGRHPAIWRKQITGLEESYVDYGPYAHLIDQYMDGTLGVVDWDEVSLVAQRLKNMSDDDIRALLYTTSDNEEIVEQFVSAKNNVLEYFETLVESLESERARNLGTEARVWVPPWKRGDDVVEEIVEEVDGPRLTSQEGPLVFTRSFDPQPSVDDIVEEAVTDVVQRASRSLAEVDVPIEVEGLVAEAVEAGLTEWDRATAAGFVDVVEGFVRRRVDDALQTAGIAGDDLAAARRLLDTELGIVPSTVEEAVDVAETFTKEGLGVRFGLDIADPADSFLFQRELFTLFGRPVVFRVQDRSDDIYVGIALLDERFPKAQKLVHDFAKSVGFKQPDSGIIKKRVDKLFGKDRVVPVFVKKADDNLADFLPIVDDVPGVVKFSDMDHSDLVQMQEALIFNWLVENQNRGLNIIKKNSATGDLVLDSLDSIRLGGSGFTGTSIREYAEGIGRDDIDRLRLAIFDELTEMVGGATTRGELADQLLEMVPIVDDRSEVAGALEMLAEEIRLGGAARELNAAELAQISESLRRTLADDTTDLWRQFMKAVDDEMVEVSFTDIEPFLLKLESEDGMQFAKEYAKIIYGADGLTDAQLDDFLLRLRTVRQQVEEFYEGLGVPVRKPDLGVEITAGERLARDMADQLGFDVKPVYTVRRQVDEVDEVDLPPSFWTEQPDLSLRRLGEEVSDDEVSSALEFGIWQYLTSTKGLDVIDVPVRPGGMVLPTGVDALTDFTKPQTFAEFMENDWAFRGLRERFIAGEIDIDFDGVAAILDRVERMDQAEWVGQVDDLIGAGGFARAKFLGLRERVEQTFNEWISLRNSRLGIEALEEGGEVVEWTPAWRRMLGEGAPEGQVVSAKAIQSKRGPDWDNLRESLEQCRRKNS